MMSVPGLRIITRRIVATIIAHRSRRDGLTRRKSLRLPLKLVEPDGSLQMTYRQHRSGPTRLRAGSEQTRTTFMSDHLQFLGYDTEGFFDELFNENNRPRPEGQLLVETINSLGVGELRMRQEAIERTLMRMGITFARLRRRTGNREDLSFRYHSAHRRCRGVEPRRSRTQTADPRAQLLH